MSKCPNGRLKWGSKITKQIWPNVVAIFTFHFIQSEGFCHKKRTKKPGYAKIALFNAFNGNTCVAKFNNCDFSVWSGVVLSNNILFNSFFFKQRNMLLYQSPHLAHTSPLHNKLKKISRSWLDYWKLQPNSYRINFFLINRTFRYITDDWRKIKSFSHLNISTSTVLPFCPANLFKITNYTHFCCWYSCII